MQKPAAHPFRVGEMYASRMGEYEVVSITPPTMTVRYGDNNQLVVTDISISARIWENLQLPPEAPEPKPPTRARAKPTTAPRPQSRPRNTKG
jgi:hypothetical protein